MSDEVVIQRTKKKRTLGEARPAEPKTSSNQLPDKRLGKASKKLDTMRGEIQTLEEEASSLDLDGLGGPEAVFKREYRKMLKYNARLIKRLNEQLEQQISSRDIYALSTLMSQQREVIADLRTIVDMSEQVDMVQRQVLVPFVSDSAQLVTDVYYQLRKLITETSTPKHTQFALRQLDELIRQIGAGLQTSHESAKEKLLAILLGEQDTGKRKKR